MTDGTYSRLFSLRWDSIEEVPEATLEDTWSRRVGNDVYTPLKMGKEWLYERLAQWQPRTAAVLMQGGPLFVVAGMAGDVPPRYSASLLQEVNGRIIEIRRNQLGRNLDDADYPQVSQQYRAQYQRDLHAEYLPAELGMAYYGRFSGFKFAYNEPWHLNNVGLLTPLPWFSLDGLLDDMGLKKKYWPWFAERIPGFRCGTTLDPGDVFSPVRIFAVQSNYQRPEQGCDRLFVKTHIKDRLIYHVRNNDFANTRVLADYLPAIDGFLEHTLLNRPGAFDFMPYTEPVNGRWGDASQIEPFYIPESFQAPVIHWGGPLPETRKSIHFTEQDSEPRATRFGGQPDWLEQPQWPVSKSLGEPMTFVGQIKLEDAGIDAIDAAGKMAYIFISEYQGEVVHGSYDPYAGENAVIIQPNGQYEGRVLDQAIGPSVGDVEGEALCQTYGVQLTTGQEPAFIKQEKREKLDYAKGLAYEKCLSGCKLGGGPGFKQGDEFPNRNQKWYQLLQLEGDDLPFDLAIGDSGTLHVFVNKNARRGYLLWQCG